MCLEQGLGPFRPYARILARHIGSDEEMTMPTIFTRLYETEAQATDVVAKLNAIDYQQRITTVVTKPIPAAEGEDGAAPTDSVASDLEGLGVYKAAASKYAAKMVPGNAVLVVNAPFGAAGSVARTMDSVNTINAGVQEENNLVEDVRSPTSIIQFTPSRHSITRYTPKAKVGAPKSTFLGLKTISQPKKRPRPSNKPITPGLIISR